MLVQWSPWHDLSRLEHAMNHLLNDGASAAPKNESAVPTWQPAVDVVESAEKILLIADLPGVDEKDLEISIDKNVLTVRGERKGELNAEAGGHNRRERVFGPFSRAFALPPTVDAEKVTADLKSGVLTLSLSKKSEAQPRQIKVQVS